MAIGGVYEGSDPEILMPLGFQCLLDLAFAAQVPTNVTEPPRCVRPKE